MKPYELPFRVNHATTIPRRNTPVREIRTMVADADRRTLSIDRTAIEVLRYVCGTWLLDAQADALLPTMDQRLRAAGRQPPPASGPFHGTDVFGAIFGLAHFMLHHGGEWTLATIPSSSAERRPDIYALPRQGRPWFVELKGVAPQSSQIRPAKSYDTCSHVKAQVDKAVKQVAYRGVAGELASPVRFRTGIRRGTSVALGGHAIAATILPDGWLRRRTDVPALTAEGCPERSNCADHCLRAHSSRFETSLVGLLWYEANASAASSHRDSRWRRLLTAAQALHAAAWADCVSLADEALLAMAEVSARTPFSRSLVSDALRASRGVTSRAARGEAAAFALRDLGEELEAEIDLGRAERPRRVSLDAMASGDVPPHAEFNLEADGFTGGGTIINGCLQITPSRSLIERAADEGADYLASAARHGLSSALRRVLREDAPFRASELDRVAIGDGERSWSVGWQQSIPPFRDLRRGPPWSWAEAQRRYRDGDGHALLDWIHMQIHEMDFRKVKDLDRLFEDRVAWSSFDGRISIPMPLSQ